jgi:hypothetical protein
MPAEHHVLLLDIHDVIVMSGAHVKKVRHPSAKICTTETIKDVFKSGDGPWKLHILAHGTDNNYTAGTIPSISETDLGNYVKESGLPNEDGAVVRLDACYAGLGGLGSLVSKLKAELENRFKPDKCKIVVEGALGANILGWDLKSDKRIVIKPDAKSDAKAGEINDYALNKNKLYFEQAQKLCKNLKLSTGSHILSMIASHVYQLAQGYLSDFNQEIRKHPEILIDRTTVPKSYKLRK